MTSALPSPLKSKRELPVKAEEQSCVCFIHRKVSTSATVRVHQLLAVEDRVADAAGQRHIGGAVGVEVRDRRRAAAAHVAVAAGAAERGVEHPVDVDALADDFVAARRLRIEVPHQQAMNARGARWAIGGDDLGHTVLVEITDGGVGAGPGVEQRPR
jgi:hypothetical protein